MRPILIVGSIAFDTLHLGGKCHSKVLGGSATYASMAAAHFNPVQLVGVVGQDFPDSATKLLRDRGVDLSGLEIAQGDTFHWEGRYSEDLSSRETLRTDLNVFAEFKPKIPQSFRRAPFVMLGNIDPTLQIEVLDQIEKPAFVLADTMNLWIDIRQGELKALCSRVDMLVLNDEEARQLTDKANLVHAAKALRALGPKQVVIKKGEHGALLFQNDDVFALPALPLSNVVDPTGAGDTFAGAFIGHLARTNDLSATNLRRSLAYGSVLASYCVEGIGMERVTKVNAAEVDARFDQLRRITSF
ncbi:MAG TPA: PfkB family carbohydrate kinase [Polyangiales bacterium]|jgi:sugar/nucleoside kinase (ribokinase family)|nr:PfkB family carbohydrate kinase [Polyangiales bacterium]